MNHDEYSQLVKASEVFQKLDENFQKEILKAHGSDKDRYIKIFQTERNGITAAQKEFIHTTNSVVHALEKDMQKTKQTFMKSAEAHTKEDEEEQAEALLDSM